MKKILILTIAAVFLTAGAGFSQMRGGGEKDGFKMPHGKWWKIPAVKEELKITDDEQKKLDTLYIDSRRKMINLKATVEKEKLELEISLDGEKFSKKTCMNQYKKLQTAKDNLAKERFSFIVEARDLFGQERFAKIASKRKAFMKRGGMKSGGKCPISIGKQGDMSGGKGCSRMMKAAN